MSERRASVHEFGALSVGTQVEVRRRFDYSWTRGFEVAQVGADGYRLKRRSDGRVLPTDFSFEDVRVERRRAPMWWA